MRKQVKHKQKSTLMLRESALALGIMLVAFFGMIGFAQSASAVSLKYNTLVEDNVITLGDVFTGLDRKADKVLGPAPRPGQDMTLNART